MLLTYLEICYKIKPTTNWKIIYFTFTTTVFQLHKLKFVKCVDECSLVERSDTKTPPPTYLTRYEATVLVLTSKFRSGANRDIP